MIFDDTGYFIALFDPDDSLNARAHAWSRAIREPLVLTDYVLLETVNHFSRQGDRPRAQAIVDTVLFGGGYVIVPSSVELFHAGLALHRQRPDKDWSLTDCISFHVMSDRGITQAMAHDKHFQQAGFDALLRRDPPAP